MNRILILAAGACITATAGSAANAQAVGNLLGTPLVGVGNLLANTAGLHAGVATTVNTVAPGAENATDGVTNAITAVGSGVSASGNNISANGVQLVRGANGRPLVSVGTSAPANQGSVAALLNGHP